ncbi:bifunctional ADP-dependent (S)-NAD(P)H-hydrate dehydratase/NAD(P)H-hydrate epimerase [Hydrococcus rivularis NIES-593]|uniref:Bifunctional NAD(P)H-hydrate repair enzyme n=1 Tax=Hydrococcus rivularis NIES-593 TaxID=1921803 RepID=A0A1U7HMQ2_9CYAN|nr:bifunctional ADP-dependent NAD(P)H-hydrate dehydratase/NAD(P)H-hydrate epimerase [Hydrococcus rivularis]OKH24866.1 bifunctional ADP-dependent (S)-NAD(P)H-hydrate dehydratase/NAD(P)H-hydrate epimerase [Hydrococcus rivularis NIES-593]
MNPQQQLEQVVVTAEQMRQIEARIFAAGMPVAALMEKAAGLTASRIRQLYPLSQVSRVGILIGPGHNGGDALVIARELHLAGYQVSLYRPFAKLKDLTAQHAEYAENLGIPSHKDLQSLQNCELIIDGLFGFGLERSLSGEIAEAIDRLNEWSQPVVSIDIPSGLHTDTGEVLGTAVRATYTLCLGLWKRGFFQDAALEYIGKAERIDFGVPPQEAWAILSQSEPIRQINLSSAKQYLPVPRPPVTHKYKQGHLLVICGSRRYAGGAILTGLGARASGVGMLSIAVPESLKPLLVTHLSDALIIDCPETETGAIAQLPPIASDFSKYQVIACGPGLTQQAQSIVQAVLKAECPLVLDADGLNNLAQLGTMASLSLRKAPTVLTPHLGEFKRLFPDIDRPDRDRIQAVQKAAAQSGAIILLKGARTAIAHPQGSVWLVPTSTPALARGGSGDVLTGLIGGLLAQSATSDGLLEALVATAAWWHAQAGILAAQERTELGVDAFTLSQYLLPFLSNAIDKT